MPPKRAWLKHTTHVGLSLEVAMVTQHTGGRTVRGRHVGSLWGLVCWLVTGSLNCSWMLSLKLALLNLATAHMGVLAQMLEVGCVSFIVSCMLNIPLALLPVCWHDVRQPCLFGLGELVGLNKLDQRSMTCRDGGGPDRVNRAPPSVHGEPWTC